LVEKRTMAFIVLAMLVWTSVATGFAAYYYLEQARYHNQLDEKQKLLNGLSENYSVSITKRNLLSGEYGTLLGEYQWLSGENYSSLMGKYEKLLTHLSGSHTSVLNKSLELNTTYDNLLNEFQKLNAKSQVSREEFGSLLDKFYKLFVALTMKELEDSISRASEIHVSLCINYTKIGEPKAEWYNTSFSPSATLFDLTQKVANVEYSYYPTMEPGHILVASINNYTAWWIWYYWDETMGDWSWGPIGCDGWILEDNGIYKWDTYS